MIPAAILLIILVFALILLAAFVVSKVTQMEERVQDKIDAALVKQAEALVTKQSLERWQGDMQYEMHRLKGFTKIPDDYKAI